MDDSLAFSQHGYEIQKELGHNRAGGRVTYLALDLRLHRQVVIKQFQFAQTSSSWGGYDTYQREIQVLRGLHHPGIARYLSSFQTPNGFCMVQEYKKAYSLGVLRSFSRSEIEHIAVALLKILIYLQNRLPIVIHRDVKPENILIDDQLNVYLVDFGFARIGDGEVGVSSVVKGSMGFMPPEQLFNRQLTEASDLYGLGVTLICLLTRTKSQDVGNLIDLNCRVNFRHLIPKISPDWVDWLEQLVEPRLTDRFANASMALECLPPHSMLLPAVQLSCQSITLKATQSSELLTHVITVHNPIPETILEGVWEVVPHPSDPAHEGVNHPWITFNPPRVQGNYVQSQVAVNSDRLVANKIYSRQIRLRTTTPIATTPSSPPRDSRSRKAQLPLNPAIAYTQTLDLQVQTAPSQLITRHQPALVPLGLLTLGSTMSTGLMAYGAWSTGNLLTAPYPMALSMAAGVSIGFEAAACLVSLTGATTGATAGALGGIMVGVLAFLAIAFAQTTPAPSTVILAGISFGMMGGVALGGTIGVAVEQLRQRHIRPDIAILLALLTTAVGSSLGLGVSLGFGQAIVWLVLAALGCPLGLALGGLLLHRLKLQNQHRPTSQPLIRP
jgi:serine/threonine protein kinase